ncbi:PaaI family thioesterase [Microvirga brassicacearum]|uniref:PaaI family thioesterase n=1 Tax=Microvirga brassicacearum TaxID=2580413 RepID=A0A5N3PEA6_9HYPH|nr:PaaI family thioesterase [Microvirga brassicacearum]KAB0268049.1 PaaI family thioesterase [Microvirga brassicacearum]
MTSPTAPDLERWLRQSPFVAFMGLELASADPAEGKLALRMKLKPEFERSAGASGRWHGGVISALADTAGNFALIMVHGAPPPTVNIRIDYLRPIMGEAVIATALVRKTGRSIAFVDIDIHSEDGSLVAIGRANYATSGLQGATPRERKP